MFLSWQINLINLNQTIATLCGTKTRPRERGKQGTKTKSNQTKIHQHYKHSENTLFYMKWSLYYCAVPTYRSALERFTGWLELEGPVTARHPAAGKGSPARCNRPETTWDCWVLILCSVWWMVGCRQAHIQGGVSFMGICTHMSAVTENRRVKTNIRLAAWNDKNTIWSG